jgi:exodeoxyribonuclease-3
VSLRLLSYNIRYGGIGRENLIARVIAHSEPDLIVLQEATSPEVVQKIAAILGMKTWGALRGHSLAYISRVEVSNSIWHRVAFARRRYLEVVLAGSGHRIFGIHLAAIHSNLTEQRRIWETNSVLRNIAAAPKGFHVLTGDFNTLAPGERLDLRSLPLRLRAIVWMTGRNIRWRTIQRMLSAGYVDGYRMLHPEGEAFTFPTWDPHVRLDYIFVPQAFAARLSRCEIVRDATGVGQASDHFPLFSELSGA